MGSFICDAFRYRLLPVTAPTTKNRLYFDSQNKHEIFPFSKSSCSALRTNQPPTPWEPGGLYRGASI
jgi:hypothetical protein